MKAGEVRIPTYLLGMQLGAATIQNKRHPIRFNWAALADGLSLLVVCGYVGATFLTEWTWDKEGREIDLHLRAAVEFFATPIFAIWFRALSETATMRWSCARSCSSAASPASSCSSVATYARERERLLRVRVLGRAVVLCKNFSSPLRARQNPKF